MACCCIRSKSSLPPRALTLCCSLTCMPMLQLVQEEEVGKYVAPEQQEAQRGGPGSSGRGSRSARAARRQGQYDADAGRDDATAEHYSGGGAAGVSHAAEGRQAAEGSSAINRQSGQRGDAHGRLWEGTSGGAAHADAPAVAPAGPAAESTDGQHEPGFQHFSMKQHKHAGRGDRQREADGEGGMSPGRQASDSVGQLVVCEGDGQAGAAEVYRVNDCIISPHLRALSAGGGDHAAED